VSSNIAAADPRTAAGPGSEQFWKNELSCAEGFEVGAVLGDGAVGDRMSSYASASRKTLWARIVAADGGQYGDHIELAYMPNAGVWNTKFYIPGGISLDCHLDKSSDRLPFRSHYYPSNSSQGANKCEAYIDWSAAAGAQIELMLARRRTTPALLQLLAAESLQQSLTIPFVRARVATRAFAKETLTVNLSALFQGPRPDLVTVFCVDSRVVAGKSDNGVVGGEQVAAWHFSGARLGSATNNQDHTATTEAAAGTLASPPHITSAQVQYGTRRYPVRARDQPAPQDVSEAYMAYKMVSKGALSKSQFERQCPVQVFDLTDSGTAKSSLQGLTSDMSSGIRGSLEVNLTLIPNQSEVAHYAAQGNDFTVVIIGYSTAAVEVSQSTGSVRRLGW
jgi:hypothetical protein